jgi:hypothetical protein
MAFFLVAMTTNQCRADGMKPPSAHGYLKHEFYADEICQHSKDSQEQSVVSVNA